MTKAELEELAETEEADYRVRCYEKSLDYDYYGLEKQRACSDFCDVRFWGLVVKDVKAIVQRLFCHFGVHNKISFCACFRSGFRWYDFWLKRFNEGV